MEVSRYGGVAGDIVDRFVSKSTLISAIPVILFVGILTGLSAYLLSGSLSVLLLPITTIIFALPIARFAIPARLGHFEEGFITDKATWKDTLQYAVRYCLANLIWIVPVVVISMALGVSSVMDDTGPYGTMSLFTSASGILLFVLVIFAILGPLLALLVATSTEEIGEIFDKDLWMSFVSVYRAELVMFCASAIGAVFMFWFVFAIPLLLLCALAFSISTGFGAALLGFIGLLPAATSPIILGKLAGALIYSLEQDAYAEHDEEINATASANPASSNSSEQNTNATDNAATQSDATHQAQIHTDPHSQALTQAHGQVQSNSTLATEAEKKAETEETHQSDSNATSPILSTESHHQAHGSKLKLIEQKLENLDQLKKANALTMAQNAQKNQADEPYPFAEEVLIHCKFEEWEQALSLANRALPKAINYADKDLVAKLFNSLGSARTKLKLAPPVIVRLKNSLIETHQYLMAVQAMLILIKMQPDDDSHKETILDIAFTAQQNKHNVQAKKIYAFFVKKFANHSMASVAQKALEDLNHA